MYGMAICACIALAWASVEIPVTIHSAVTAIEVVSVLRAVALRAELFGLRELKRLSVS